MSFAKRNPPDKERQKILLKRAKKRKKGSGGVEECNTGRDTEGKNNKGRQVKCRES